MSGPTFDTPHKLVVLSRSDDKASAISNFSARTPKSAEFQSQYRQTFNISRTLVGNKLVDYSDVVGASPVGAAQLRLHSHLASMDWTKRTARRDEKHFSFGIWYPYIRGLTVTINDLTNMMFTTWRQCIFRTVAFYWRPQRVTCHRTLEWKCNSYHWLHWKLSFWQLPVQPVMKMSSKWQHLHFRESQMEHRFRSTLARVTDLHQAVTWANSGFIICVRPNGIYLRAISQQVLQPPLNLAWRYTYLKTSIRSPGGQWVNPSQNTTAVGRYTARAILRTWALNRHHSGDGYYVRITRP